MFKNIFIVFFIFVSFISSTSIFAAQSAACPNGTARCDAPSSYKITMIKMELCTGAPLTSFTDVTCNGAVLVGTANKEFDIASVGVGAEIGKFIDTSGLPIGTKFTHAKPTFSRAMKITGSVNVTASITCNTDSNASGENLTGNGAHSSGGKYKTIAPGKTNGSPTEQTFYMFTDATESGDTKVCRSDNSDNDCDSSDSQTWTKTATSDPSLYGAALANPGVSTANTSMIYRLTSPFTVGLSAPKIKLAFGTANALEGNTDGAGTGCWLNPHYPKVNITITD